MAKPDRDEAGGKRKRRGKTIDIVLTGLAAVGLLGFGVTSFTSTATSIGKVGSISISTDEYARAFRLRASDISQQFGQQLPAQDLMDMGVGAQVLGELIAGAALDNEAHEIGISATDAVIADLLRRQPAFAGTDGKFDRAGYEQTLQQNGWTVPEYEAMLRKSVGRAALQEAVSDGFAAPAPVVEVLYRHAGERRSFSYLRLSGADAAALVDEPQEADLRAYYDAHVADFTRPEAKRIRYAALVPDQIAADQPVDEEALRKTYEANLAQYVMPERRLVERLVFPDEAARDAARADLDAGVAFETLVESRGLTLDAIDLGDVSEKALGPAGPDVFAAPEGAVVAAESTLGPALFRINGRLDGQEVTFEDARPALAQEAQEATARKDIADRIDDIDDLLAGGETLDDLARLEGMTLGSVDYVPHDNAEWAIHPDPITGYAAFQEAADNVREGDYPEAIVLDDGGVVAIEMTETLPSEPLAFDDVRDRVARIVTGERVKEALAARADDIRDQVTGGAALDSLGTVHKVADVTRNDQNGAAPRALVTAAFAMASGDLRVIDTDNAITLLQLDAVTPAPEDAAIADPAREAIGNALRVGFASDAFARFANTVADRAGIKLEQNVINQMNASL